MHFPAHVRVGRTGAGIDAGHLPVTDGGEQHGHHGDQNRGDHVAARFIIDHAINSHRRDGLNDHNPDDDPSHRPRTRRSFAGEADCVLTMRLQIFSRGRRCCSRNEEQFQSSQWRPRVRARCGTGSCGAPLGRGSFGDDCLDQVARVIDVAAVQDREMICEELERHNFRDGQEELWSWGTNIEASANCSTSRSPAVAMAIDFPWRLRMYSRTPSVFW